MAVMNYLLFALHITQQDRSTKQTVKNS